MVARKRPARRVGRPAVKAVGRPGRRYKQTDGVPLWILRLALKPDGRCKYDVRLKRAAGRLIEMGFGRRSIAAMLGIPTSTAREWIMTYRARGLKGLYNMGERRRQFSDELKIAAARDHVENGMSRREVMVKYDLGDVASLKRWCRKYREGGFGCQGGLGGQSGLGSRGGSCSE